MAVREVRRRRRAIAAGLATMAMALGLAAVPAEAAPPPLRVDLVAVGDSYTAGTGAGPFTSPFPCIQTAGGYVDVLDSQPVLDLAANAACHGALLDSIAQPGNVPSVMQQVAGLTASGALTGRTELVTLTAGANDVGVNTALYYCANFTSEVCQQAVGGAVQLLPSVGADLTAALVAVHRAAPRAKITVLGYPMLFDPLGGVPVIPAQNQVLVNGGTALLNATIAASVTAANALYRANAQYIDVTARFAGHEANSLDPWIVLDSSPQAFHPNATGHEQYAGALLAAVDLSALARR